MADRTPIRSTLEWIALFLLAAAPLGTVVLYGGVRLWMYAPFLLGQCLGAVVLLTVWFMQGGTLRVPIAWTGLLAVAAYCLYAMPGATVPYAARLEFIKWASYLLAYWGLTETLSTRTRREVIMGLFLLIGSLLCLYAIIQHVRGSTMVLALPRPEQYDMRASGTYICPNHFAHILELLVIVGASMAAMRSAGWVVRILGGYAAVLALPVLLLTGSRSGWIGIVAGIGVLLGVLASRKGIVRLLITMVSLSALVAIAVSALWAFSPLFKERVQHAIKGDMRPYVWADTLDMIQDEPVMGHGPGSYRWMYPKFKNAYRQVGIYPRYAHNEYLNTLAEFGIVGTSLAGLAVLFYCVRLLGYARSTRERDTAIVIAMGLACAGATAAHGVFDFNLRLFANMQIVILLAAYTSAVLLGSGDRKPLKCPRYTGEAVSAIGAIACLVLMAMVGQVLAGYLQTNQAEKHREELELDQALLLTDKAIAVYPGYWKAHKERAMILKTKAVWNPDYEEKQEQAQASAASFKRALELNPRDAHSLLELSTVHGDLLGDPDRAVDLLHAAIELTPGMPYYYAQLGLRLRRMGHLDEALEAFQTAYQYRRSDEMVRLNISRLKKLIRQRDARNKRENAKNGG